MEIQFRDHATRNVVSLAFGKADPKGERGEILTSTRETQPPRIRSLRRGRLSERLFWGNRISNGIREYSPRWGRRGWFN